MNAGKLLYGRSLCRTPPRFSVDERNLIILVDHHLEIDTAGLKSCNNFHECECEDLVALCLAITCFDDGFFSFFFF